jgi:hypothetical protein
MNQSTSYDKSPTKGMFSSAFRREDIRGPAVRKNAATSRDKSPVKVLQENNFVNQKTTRSVTPTMFKGYEENFNTISVSEVSKEQVKYEELLKKYERMQEFYKSQLCSLAEEVEHYKTLYQKVMKYKNIEQI